MSSFKIGLVGKPNVGKSTIFSALTKHNVDIGNYPFTTVKPNTGVTFIRHSCPEVEIGGKCDPSYGYCVSGIRYIPVQVVDVPGLIKGASQGKGMGNQFLDSIRDSDATVQIFDSTGRTDMMGNESINPENAVEEEINMINDEIVQWAANTISADWDHFSRRADSSSERLGKSLSSKLSHFRISESQMSEILSAGIFPSRLSIWGTDDFLQLARLIIERTKPRVLLGNKMDLISDAQAEKILNGRRDIFLTSGETELILSKAIETGVIESETPPFQVSRKASQKQIEALDRIEKIVLRRGYSSLRKVMEETVYVKLGRIVVFPVYDETLWRDRQGKLLPDAFFMKSGETALDLAYRVHTEIGENFIKAIDGRTHRTLGKDYVLKDGDVIKIVSRS
ncbi:MAG: YchF-related putative GTPase [Candidatus Thermoplasmatota archaeon]|nr:YchF-related putative GTPase [Candidatus Thermoplasmatota archaeon]MCL5731006.1 YchF-related putative GTPase [Candidatus Thermoplasmatota archaeon]